MWSAGCTALLPSILPTSVLVLVDVLPLPLPLAARTRLSAAIHVVYLCSLALWVWHMGVANNHLQLCRSRSHSGTVHCISRLRMRVTLVAAVLKLAMAAYPPAPQPSAAYPPAPQPGGPASRVELRISCKNLLRSDILSKSDPLVAVYTLDQRGAYTEVLLTTTMAHAQQPREQNNQ